MSKPESNVLTSGVWLENVDESRPAASDVGSQSPPSLGFEKKASILGCKSASCALWQPVGLVHFALAAVAVAPGGLMCPLQTEQEQMKSARFFLVASVAILLASCGPTGDDSAPEGGGPEPPVVGQPTDAGDEVAQQPSVAPEPEAPVEPPGPEPETPLIPEIGPETPLPAVTDLQPQTATTEAPAETTEASAATTSPHQKQLDESLQKWNDLKAACGGNYSYKISWSSFAGFGHETEIVVRDNKVTERRYRERSGPPALVEPGKPPQENGEGWAETGDELGSHKQGAPPKTLDELYVEAQGILNKQLEPHHKLYVRFDKQGLLSSCFYIDTRIADDAPQTGVVISSIELAKADGE